MLAQGRGGAAVPSVRTARVADIQIAYQDLGSGHPVGHDHGIRRIDGPLEPAVSPGLCQSFLICVIIFDNRGMGLLTSSDQGLF